MMATGFEGDIGSCAFGPMTRRTSFLECHNFGVVTVGVNVDAFCDDLAFGNQDAAYLWVGGGERRQWLQRVQWLAA